MLLRHGIIISFTIIFNMEDKRHGALIYVLEILFQGLVKVMCQLHFLNKHYGN